MLLGHEKTSFLHLPTPLEYLPGVSADLGVEFYIKRDDLTNLGVGGNKLRKLEYLLKDAQDQGCTMLLTLGGAQTNHGRLTAAVAAKFGMKCAIVCVDPYPGELSANLLLDRLMGAEVILKKDDGRPESEQFAETAAAVKAAYAAYDAYKDDLRDTARQYIAQARQEGRPILVVCGRPYHMDPEINHGINDLITSYGFVLVTEDAVAYLEDKAPRHVLNQWTYHARMYNAARYVCTQPDMEVIQLVSFGCGIDAITGDEMRSILEEGGKRYTQLKIDDISNLGAVKIRIRSLMAAIEARNKH